MSATASGRPVRVRKPNGPVVNAYLFLYNATVCFGWGYVLYLTIKHYVDGGKPIELWPKIEYWLKLSQTLALLEIVHSILGFVTSPIGSTVMQVASRIYILWGVLNLENETHYTNNQAIAITTLMFAWCPTEVIRYSFYALKIYEVCPYFLLWLRYTTFYPLYPLGVGSELACLFFRLPYIYESRPYSLTLPNKFNWSFDSLYIVPLVGLAYVYGFPLLYTYMIKQRKKNLGPAVADKVSGDIFAEMKKTK
ncbi:very-long-chain (3R)-3-hydroxyacyl-CoA dehydratase [Acrasis kona]|uniref:very-long-chain (3R)-3-hydroxyacyl-CoA dehydratase n=1 Tax=Acrasis kona TaxID=1008807 RepID=A0AAW2Z392_9EUKA